jgi:glycosyltransferase involved in cell wall biosynthesis
MASGIPVLGFDHGGNRDLVEHGVNGYLAEPGNFDDLAEGLNFCMKNWGVLGANGRELAKKWTWENACEKMIEVWKLAMVEEEPTVSIIIPTYNYADKVGRAIESGINQDYDKLGQILVVDDGSTDEGATERLVSGYREIDSRVSFIRQSNAGVARARNTGIANVGSKYVCCLDGDDAIEPQFLKACIDELEADRSLGIAYTGLRWIKPDGSTGISEWPGEYDYDQQIVRKNQIPTCCVFRREIWERLGGYKSRYCPTGAGSEDAEYWTRAGSIGFGAKKVTTAPLFIYSWQSGHTSQQDYSEVDWLAWHPYTRDGKHPFASVATPINKISHAVRQYDEPLVSVIIPVGPGHNRKDILENAIDSVEAQTFRKWELILVNDSNELLPANFFLSYPYVRHMTTTGKEGAGAARNWGAENARAPFLLFLDADDWLHPDCLTDMLEEWRHEEAIIYSDYTRSRRIQGFTK